jgi:hypothetical protein
MITAAGFESISAFCVGCKIFGGLMALGGVHRRSPVRLTVACCAHPSPGVRPMDRLGADLA